MTDSNTSGTPRKGSALDRQFQALTGYLPLSWQSRLFSEHFEKGDLPAAVDIPTGLGKTAVIALWLIGRARGSSLPRRLVYVVDRRAVVDQATDFAGLLARKLDSPDAVDLKKALGLGGRSFPISTLRGQFVDNREWLEDPVSIALVVGTVDMIGSRLLFEGYGVSRKTRSYHAGLLGSDTLVILDEAHLVPPFEALMEAIERDTTKFGARHEADRKVIPPFKLLSLSATGRQRAGKVFRLQGSFAEPNGQRGDLDDDIVAQRIKAKKGVEIVEAGQGGIEEDLAQHAWRLTEQGKAPIRCIVFCDKREIAEKTQRKIEALVKGGKTEGRPPVQIDRPELFVGARRVLERTGAAKRLVELGFIAGSDVPRTSPDFLIATSAGEVGVDLDADHMVCDLVAWERMVQRLGRVNRRGDGDAKVVVIFEPDPSPNKAAKAALEKPAEKRDAKDLKAIASYTASVAQTRAFQRPFQNVLERRDDGLLDASPGAIRALRDRATGDSMIAEIMNAATTPPPLRPALTRAVVDAWSMTSLEEHTGRPEIAPWLRGWVEDEKPQTTVLWRKHLPVRTAGTGATKKEIEAFFEAAPPHASEELETETYRVKDWLLKRSFGLLKSSGRNATVNEDAGEGNAPALSSSASFEPLHDKDVVAFILSKSGDLYKTVHLADLRNLQDPASAKAFEEKLIGTILIVDARFGGLKDGLLNAGIEEVAKAVDDGGEWMRPEPSDRDPATLPPVVPFRVEATTLKEQGTERGWRSVYSFISKRNEEGEPIAWLIVEEWRDASTTEEGRSASSRPQTLVEHQSWTEAKARTIAEKLGLEEAYAEALAIAARLHDEGKKASRWQRAFKAPGGKEPYAKTRGPIDFALLDGYRHEFGSLPYVLSNSRFGNLSGGLQDLVLHLVAAHHGNGRPVIGTNGCEDMPPSALEERALQVALRFARLQKRWGPWGLAWWEALLRAADQQASRENDQRGWRDA